MSQASWVGLSVAHERVRTFGVRGDQPSPDEVLSEAVAEVQGDASEVLGAYAAALPQTVCAVAAPGGGLGAAQVERVGDVAVVRPGVGPVVLPEGVTSVVVDLRGLPEVPGLREALAAAVAPALGAPVKRATRQVIESRGFPDEAFGLGKSGVYTRSLVKVTPGPLEATGAQALPLALLTEARLSPEAAELAGTLRLARRAWVLGEGVRAEVAEAQWQPVGPGGLLVRTENLLRSGTARWPDEIPADGAAPDAASLGAVLSSLPPPGEVGGEAARAALALTPPAAWGATTEPMTAGQSRAGLLIVHGLLRRFYPYFPVVGDRIDERLLETLEAVGAGPETDRAGAVRLLRRLGEAIDDGHNFVGNVGEVYQGSLPVVLAEVNAEPVVRRSATPDLVAGDTIVALDGVPFAQWLNGQLAMTSAASDGYRFDLATRFFLQMKKSLGLTLRAPDGQLRTVQATPASSAVTQALGNAPVLRPNGWLTELGASDIYYLNLSSDVTKTTGEAIGAITQASAAKGLVVDMRGYPGVDIYQVASFLMNAPFKSPLFLTRVWRGPDESRVETDVYPLDPAPAHFGGPIALLVGHTSVSAAETFATMLVQNPQVTVVGRPSAATNGNITAIGLPNGSYFSFTGMDVRFADESTFHGVGIVPGSPSVLSASALAAGSDPELADALAVLPP